MLEVVAEAAYTKKTYAASKKLPTVCNAVRHRVAAVCREKE
jgi:hypothetical protein